MVNSIDHSRLDRYTYVYCYMYSESIILSLPLQVISLGSNIGSGVFIATGKALAQGGPGNMVVAYTLVCSCVWAVLQTLSEMTIAFPTSGNYIDFAGRWVDPAVAFGAGLAEWLGTRSTRRCRLSPYTDATSRLVGDGRCGSSVFHHPG